MLLCLHSTGSLCADVHKRIWMLYGNVKFKEVHFVLCFLFIFYCIKTLVNSIKRILFIENKEERI